MKVSFVAFGHPNISATHKTTFELICNKELSKKGSCIVGVHSQIPDLSGFLDKGFVRLEFSVGSFSEKVSAKPNRCFSDRQELVVRIGDFSSERTFATRADKAACHFNRKMMELMKNPLQRMLVEVSDEA